jgi:hypothetical protein
VKRRELCPPGEQALGGSTDGLPAAGAARLRQVTPLGVTGGSSALASVDVGRLVGDISRTFNPLAAGFALDVHTAQLSSGLVQVSVVLPHGMTRAFVTLLESLTGLVGMVDQRARVSAAAVKALDLGDYERRRDDVDGFRKAVCDLFDGFTAQGCPRKDAVRRTNQTLKAQGHPWATLDLVTVTLRQCGRFRRG